MILQSYQRKSIMTRKDHSGEKYSRLLILCDAPNRGKHRYVYTQCECGTDGETSLTSLRSGSATSCGCYLKEISGQREDVIGEVYGRLTIIGDATTHTKHRRVVVRCACGTEKECFLTVLRGGDAVSCGCYHYESLSTHGETSTPLYRTWSNMKSRCYDVNAKYYPEYGGRGITVCAAWREDFMTFKNWAIQNGFMQGLTLDRTNNMGQYNPTNCRWASRTTQQRNRRPQKGSSSQYIGVSYNTKIHKWAASIKHSGKSYNLGQYPQEIDAAIARDRYIRAQGLTDFTMNNVLP